MSAGAPTITSVCLRLARLLAAVILPDGVLQPPIRVLNPAFEIATQQWELALSASVTRSKEQWELLHTLVATGALEIGGERWEMGAGGDHADHATCRTVVVAGSIFLQRFLQRFAVDSSLTHRHLSGGADVLKQQLGNSVAPDLRRIVVGQVGANHTTSRTALVEVVRDAKKIGEGGPRAALDSTKTNIERDNLQGFGLLASLRLHSTVLATYAYDLKNFRYFRCLTEKVPSETLNKAVVTLYAEKFGDLGLSGAGVGPGNTNIFLTHEAIVRGAGNLLGSFRECGKGPAPFNEETDVADQDSFTLTNDQLNEDVVGVDAPSSSSSVSHAAQTSETTGKAVDAVGPALLHEDPGANSCCPEKFSKDDVSSSSTPTPGCNPGLSDLAWTAAINVREELSTSSTGASASAGTPSQERFERGLRAALDQHLQFEGSTSTKNSRRVLELVEKKLDLTTGASAEEVAARSADEDSSLCAEIPSTFIPLVGVLFLLRLRARKLHLHDQ